MHNAHKSKGKGAAGQSTGIKKKEMRLSLSKLIRALGLPNSTIIKEIKKSPGKRPAFERPSFSSEKERAARLEATLATGYDYTKANLSEEDLAAPHRAPYARIRDRVLEGSASEVNKLVDSLCRASVDCEKAFYGVASDVRYEALAKVYQSTREKVQREQEEFKGSSSLSPEKKLSVKLGLLRALNNLASNAPGLGPHSTTNAIVSDRLHVHPTGLAKEPTSPRSKAATLAFPSEPVATTLAPAQKVVSVTGAKQSLQLGSQPHDCIQVGTRVMRGALLVYDKRVYRPKNPLMEPTGDFAQDWTLVS